MRKLILLTFLYLMTYRILTLYGLLPSSAKFFIEILSVFYLFLSLIVFAINKELNIGTKYLIYYLILFISILIGSALNHSSAAAIILGVRHYFKYLPIFLLPLVYSFNENDLKFFLKTMLWLFLIQAPICLYQRFILFSGTGTGDVVVGTLASSGVLSVMLICGLALAYALYLKKQIKMWMFLVVSFFLFLPTAINETKITFLVLPFALFIPNLLTNDEQFLKRIKKIIGYVFSITALLTAFVISYNFIYASNSDQSLFDYLKREKEGKGYLFHDEERIEEQMETGRQIPRGSTIVFANRYLSKDLKNYIFGIGIGNALPTKITFLTAGLKDIQEYFPDLITITNVFWEMGLVGVILQFIIYFFILKDIYSVTKRNDFVGGVSLGWCSVILVAVITLLYFNMYYNDEYNMTFWFFTGIILSFKYREKDDSDELPDNIEATAKKSISY